MSEGDGAKSTRGLRRWYWVHKWSSLVSTLFILIACVTGLPLVFHHELDALFADEDAAASEIGETLDFDALIATAENAHPDRVAQFILREPIDPGVTVIGLGERIDAPLEDGALLRIDNATGAILEAGGAYDGVLGFMTELHIELFAGQFGTLFLGLMTIFLIVAVISGVVLYAPYMGNRRFAIARSEGKTRRRWFDLHNSLGIVLAAWLLVVSVTGAINTVGVPIIQMWLMTDMKAEVTSDLAAPLPADASLASFQDAYEEAQRRLPESDFYFAIFPGTGFSSDRHYLIFNTGRTPVSSRLFTPAIINAYTGEFISAPDFPIYIKALLLSQPLHFGDYGGMTLKAAWAILDIGAILLLWSGLVVWWRRRKQSPRIVRVVPEGAAT
ncbi:MAG: PepSY domain-containing protein [Caulobacterales bacterium]|nr:PepSY domain-containing protein [Caulobacterales bacterium]